MWRHTDSKRPVQHQAKDRTSLSPSSLLCQMALRSATPLWAFNEGSYILGQHSVWLAASIPWLSALLGGGLRGLEDFPTELFWKITDVIFENNHGLQQPVWYVTAYLKKKIIYIHFCLCVPEARRTQQQQQLPWMVVVVWKETGQIRDGWERDVSLYAFTLDDENAIYSKSI